MLGRTLFAAASTLALLASAAQAQTQPQATNRAAAAPAGEDNGIAEIVVTATRVATNLQDTPIAITAVTSEALEERGAPDSELRAELLVALAIGVAVTRANGTLETLAATPREDVLTTLAPLLDALES